MDLDEATWDAIMAEKDAEMADDEVLPGTDSPIPEHIIAINVVQAAISDALDDAELGPEGGADDGWYDDDVDEADEPCADLGDHQPDVDAAAAQLDEARIQTQISEDYQLAMRLAEEDKDSDDDNDGETFGEEVKERKKKRRKKPVSVGMPKTAKQRRKEKEAREERKRKAEEEVEVEVEVPMPQAVPVIHMKKPEPGMKKLSTLAKLAAFNKAANGLGAMPEDTVLTSRTSYEVQSWQPNAYAVGQRVIAVSGATARFYNFWEKDRGQFDHAHYDGTEKMKCMSIKRGFIARFIRAGVSWAQITDYTVIDTTVDGDIGFQRFEMPAKIDDPNYFDYLVKYDDGSFEQVHGYYISFENPGVLMPEYEPAYSEYAKVMDEQRYLIEKRYKQVNSYHPDGYWHPDYGSKATGPCYRKRLE